MTINPIFILVNDLSFTNILKDCVFYMFGFGGVFLFAWLFFLIM